MARRLQDGLLTIFIPRAGALLDISAPGGDVKRILLAVERALALSGASIVIIWKLTDFGQNIVMATARQQTVGVVVAIYERLCFFLCPLVNGPPPDPLLFEEL